MQIQITFKKLIFNLTLRDLENVHFCRPSVHLVRVTHFQLSSSQQAAVSASSPLPAFENMAHTCISHFHQDWSPTESQGTFSRDLCFVVWLASLRRFSTSQIGNKHFNGTAVVFTRVPQMNFFSYSNAAYSTYVTTFVVHSKPCQESPDRIFPTLFPHTHVQGWIQSGLWDYDSFIQRSTVRSSAF